MAELLNIMILKNFTQQINNQFFEIKQKIAPSLWGQKMYRYKTTRNKIKCTQKKQKMSTLGGQKEKR